MLPVSTEAATVESTMARRSELLLSIAMLALAACESTNVYVPSVPSATASADPLDALAAIQGRLRAIICNLSRTEGGFGEAHYTMPLSASGSGSKIKMQCDGGTSWMGSYRTYPAVSIGSDNYASVVALYYICARQSLDQDCARRIYVSSMDSGQKIVDGWAVLARPRSAMQPASDPDFQAALRRATSATPDLEMRRRVQVQVELAVRELRTIDAARLYRDGLSQAPDWSDGHFNLALLYGELELYPEAITEMRRHLYLTPNAPRQRAAQDKVYEWEASLSHEAAS